MCVFCADGLNVNQSCSARDFCLPLDPCSANSVSCTSTASGALCTCQPGYSGATCQHDIDECASQPCQNGAECLDMIDEYMCDCSLGFSGQQRTCRRHFRFCFAFCFVILYLVMHVIAVQSRGTAVLLYTRRRACYPCIIVTSLTSQRLLQVLTARLRSTTV